MKLRVFETKISRTIHEVEQDLDSKIRGKIYNGKLHEMYHIEFDIDGTPGYDRVERTGYVVKNLGFMEGCMERSLR